MRSLIALALAGTLLLAGCGSGSEPERAPDPAASAPAETDTAAPETTDGPVDYELVEILSETDVGGEVDPVAVDLADSGARADFVAQFDDERMDLALEDALSGVRLEEGRSAWAAVVAIGCTPPRDVTVERVDGELLIEAEALATKDDVQCFAAVTSVAVVVV